VPAPPWRNSLLVLFSKFAFYNHYFILYNFSRFIRNGVSGRVKDRLFMEEKETMTVKQVAEYLQMDEYTIYKLVRSGQTL